MLIQDFFKLGMKREINEIKDMKKDGWILNVGSGNSVIDGAENFDYPVIDLDKDDFPFTNCIDGIHCYHVLEHLNNPIKTLLLLQTALKAEGILNIVVPHYSCQMAFQDLDHKAFFTLDTWKELFNNGYYDKYEIEWRFKINANFVLGVSDRNLAIFTQLEKI